ncbi:MAG TPA: sugar ABC transporter permease [bacterium]|nr:sugar ABC transporter permease [bacterium]
MARGEGIISGRAAGAFSAPAAALIVLFLAFPALWVIVIGFTDLTLTSVSAPSFVGLGNFSRIFHDHFFWNALKVSTGFVIGSGVIGQAGLGLLLAMMLHGEKGAVKGAIQAAAVAAWILPEVVVAYCWAAFLDADAGLLNRAITALGLPAVPWLQSHALLSIIVFNTWRGTAFSLLLFSAAIASLPPSYLETAEVLGAPAYNKFKDIILPLIRGTLLTDLILITLWTFNVFTPFLLTRGGPSFATEILPVYIYRNAFLGTFKLGFGSAAATVMLLINLGLGAFYIAAGRKR